MKALFTLFISILTFSVHANANYICQNGDVVRSIEIVYSQPDSKVPCEVNYVKPEITKIVWSAQNEVGYCETKAEGLALKLTDLGWTCSGLSDEKDGEVPKS